MNLFYSLVVVITICAHAQDHVEFDPSVARPPARTDEWKEKDVESAFYWALRDTELSKQSETAFLSITEGMEKALRVQLSDVSKKRRGYWEKLEQFMKQLEEVGENSPRGKKVLEERKKAFAECGKLMEKQADICQRAAKKASFKIEFAVPPNKDECAPSALLLKGKSGDFKLWISSEGALQFTPMVGKDLRHTLLSPKLVLRDVKVSGVEPEDINSAPPIEVTPIIFASVSGKVAKIGAHGRFTAAKETYQRASESGDAMTTFRYYLQTVLPGYASPK